MDRLSRLFGEREGPLWLNVGAGPYPEANFVNLDNHVFFLLAPFYPLARWVLPRSRLTSMRLYGEASGRGHYIRYDCRRPLHAPSPCVDHILCSHFLEHVYPDEAAAVLDGFFQALKPGGTLHLIVPDLKRQVKLYLAAGELNEAADARQPADHLLRELLLGRPQAPSWRYRLLEAVGYEGLQHRWMYDHASLTALVLAHGFVIEEENATPSAHVRADDPDSLHLVASKPR